MEVRTWRTLGSTLGEAAGFSPLLRGMSIKSSITLGFLAMLALLVGVGGYAYYTVQRLERGAQAVLQDNFYSVQLGQRMLQALDEAAADPAAGSRRFAPQLAREADNVTEPGERPLVDSLARTLASYRQQPTAAGLAQLRQHTHRLVQLNTQAISRKNAAAERTAAAARRVRVVIEQGDGGPARATVRRAARPAAAPAPAARSQRR